MLRKFQPRGLAVECASVTVIFRRPSSLVPTVVILQQNREWPAGVLRDIGITLESRAAAAQALIGDVAEEALDHVQPRRRCGREVHLEIDLLEELQPLGVAMALLALKR